LRKEGMMRNNEERAYVKDLRENPFEERGDDAKRLTKGFKRLGRRK